MSDITMLSLLAGSTLVMGLIAGVFFTFSDFVMRSFTAASEATGAEAMQSINRVIYRSGFMVILLGMVPVSALLSVIAHLGLPAPVALAVHLGTGAYLLGMFAVTVFGNVPMNNRLDALSLTDGSAQSYWTTYRVRWTGLNHIRTAATIMATACYGVAALRWAIVL